MITSFINQPKIRYREWNISEDDDDYSIGFKVYNISGGGNWKSSKWNQAEVKERTKVEVSIEIEDKVIFFPWKLTHIARCIEESKQILDLEVGWDGMNGTRIDRLTWISAAHFLINYSKFISEKFDVVISAPEINPVKNGTIDIVWKTAKARFLINIKFAGSQNFASYYGDLKNNQQPIKSVLVDDSVIEYLAYWMTNLA